MADPAGAADKAATLSGKELDELAECFGVPPRNVALDEGGHVRTDAVLTDDAFRQRILAYISEKSNG